MRVLFTLFAALALSVGVSTATAGHGHGKGGNSAAAHACQHGGYKKFVRADGTSFKNTGACVSYAAQGGTLVAKSQAQLDCESFGGSYSTDPSTDLINPGGVLGGALIFSCNGFADAGVTGGAPHLVTLSGDCLAAGGATDGTNEGVGTGPGNYDFSCYSLLA